MPLVVRRGHEGIVFFSRNACQGLEPVCIVRRTVFHSPVLLGLGHDIRVRTGEFPSVVHDVHHILKDALWEPLLHLADGENIFSEQFLYPDRLVQCSSSFCLLLSTSLPAGDLPDPPAGPVLHKASVSGAEHCRPGSIPHHIKPEPSPVHPFRPVS